MTNGRSGRLLMLLVLPVLLGLLGMHALFVAGPAPTPATPVPEMAVTAHEPAPHDRPTMPDTASDQRAPGGHSSHDDATHLLHLCLAVLAAVGLVLLTAWAFLGRIPLPASSAQSRQPARGRPAQRPPPVPRRLAQLCVMRN